MSAAATYARYSSDLQREASIEDQNRICRERAAKEGWSIYQEYSDSGISAASLIRPGTQKLLRDALDGRFGIILVESWTGCRVTRRISPISSNGSASRAAGSPPSRRAA